MPANTRRRRKFLTYGLWSEQFLKDAKANGFQSLTGYANKVLNCKSGRSVLNSTLQLVGELCGYDICGPDYEDPDFDRLLRMQTYDPCKSQGTYAIGVRTAGQRVPARILWEGPAFTDLLDFHHQHRLSRLIVSRADSRPLTKRIQDEIEAEVVESFEIEERLRFDRSALRMLVRVV